MNSMVSDSESNVSGFVRYSNDNVKKLYSSMLKGMESIYQDVLEVEKNLQNIINQSGHLEKQLHVLLQVLPRVPKPNLDITMQD